MTIIFPARWTLFDCRNWLARHGLNQNGIDLVSPDQTEGKDNLAEWLPGALWVWKEHPLEPDPEYEKAVIDWQGRVRINTAGQDGLPVVILPQ